MLGYIWAGRVTLGICLRLLTSRLDANDHPLSPVHTHTRTPVLTSHSHLDVLKPVATCRMQTGLHLGENCLRLVQELSENCPRTLSGFHLGVPQVRSVWRTAPSLVAFSSSLISASLSRAWWLASTTHASTRQSSRRYGHSLALTLASVADLERQALWRSPAQHHPTPHHPTPAHPQLSKLHPAHAPYRPSTPFNPIHCKPIPSHSRPDQAIPTRPTPPYSILVWIISHHTTPPHHPVPCHPTPIHTAPTFTILRQIVKQLEAALSTYVITM